LSLLSLAMMIAGVAGVFFAVARLNEIPDTSESCARCYPHRATVLPSMKKAKPRPHLTGASVGLAARLYFLDAGAPPIVAVISLRS